MPRINYSITIEQLPSTLNKIFKELPSRYLKQVTRELAGKTHTRMMFNSPASVKSGRGYRGAPLRFSIKTKDVSRNNNPRFFVTPTKMVKSSKGTYNLAAILEAGSPGGQIIKPVKAKRLKFVEDGKVRFERSVIRGSITPQLFIRKTWMQTKSTASDFIINRLTDIYRREAPR